MTYRVFQTAIPLLILAGGIGAMLALGSREHETLQPPEIDAVPTVKTVAVKQQEGGWDIQIDGLVQPFREIEVKAELEGRVRFKAGDCRAGRFVRAGTRLIEIDPADFQLELQRYEKQLEQAESELEENDVELSNITALLALAQRDLQLGQGELERMRELSSRDAASRSELDRTARVALAAEHASQTLENQLQSTRVRRARLDSGVELAKVLLERARLDLDRTSIKAPVDGVIVRDAVEQDGYVQKGQALFTIEDTSSVEVQSSLRMDQLYWLWDQRNAYPQGEPSAIHEAYQIPPTDATVVSRIAGLPDLRFSWRGRLTRFDGIGLDERTRTVPCRIVVDRPRDVSVSTADGRPIASPTGPPALVRGMYVTVLLHVRAGSPFVLVPDEAVQPGKFVWCVRDGRLVRVGPLTLIRDIQHHEPNGTVGQYWLAPAAESGLSVADALVVTPLAGLQQGTRVSDSPAERVATREFTPN